MPLYPPSSGAGGQAPNIIYGECNTPPSGASAALQYDTWYDAGGSDITAGKTAALAAMGLTYAAGVFTATALGVWHAIVAFIPIEAPTDQLSQVGFSTSMNQADPACKWDEATLPYEAYVVLSEQIYCAISDGFQARQTLTGTVTGTTPISYATITIMRVL